MNPPSDPLQLLVYGVGTLIVVLALKLWDRRRDGALRRVAEVAASHAQTAAEHAGTAAAAAGRVEEGQASRASAKQAETILQASHDEAALLVRILSELGELRGQIRRLESVPERMAVMERELDQMLYTSPIRRRQEPR